MESQSPEQVIFCKKQRHDETKKIIIAKEIYRGLVCADIELINADDFENVKRNIIGEDEVKHYRSNIRMF